MSLLYRTGNGRNDIAWGGGATSAATYLQRWGGGRNDCGYVWIGSNGTWNLLNRWGGGRNDINWGNVSFSFTNLAQYAMGNNNGFNIVFTGNNGRFSAKFGRYYAYATWNGYVLSNFISFGSSYESSNFIRAQIFCTQIVGGVSVVDYIKSHFSIVHFDGPRTAVAVPISGLTSFYSQVPGNVQAYMMEAEGYAWANAGESNDEQNYPDNIWFS